MERIAVIPGSFDPITKGHEDLVLRGAALLGRATLLVMENGAKHSRFSFSQRLAIARAAFADMENITVEGCKGMLCDYVKEHPGSVIVKGARDTADFSYEYTLYEINRELENCETVILPARKENVFLSSTFVRELLRCGRDYSPYVPKGAAEQIRRILADNT